MKKLAALVVLLSTAAFASPYGDMVVKYDYTTVGGVTSLNVRLYNNGATTANCEVEVFNRSERVTVRPAEHETVSFSSLPEGAQPRYGCEAR